MAIFCLGSKDRCGDYVGRERWDRDNDNCDQEQETATAVHSFSVNWSDVLFLFEIFIYFGRSIVSYLPTS